MDTRGPFEEADVAATSALNTPVGEKSWGLFVQKANPEPGIDERGHFLWFENREELLEFMSRHLVRWISLGGGEVEDLPKICDEAVTLVKKVTDRQVRLSAALEELSDWLYEFNMEITWAGSFQELLTGLDEFPMAVRSWFRRILDDEIRSEVRPEDSLPIRKDESENFQEALEHYEEILE
ncbi:MAG: hypothetical protein V2A34_09045 [Lentisphaerota bacterium]